MVQFNLKYTPFIPLLQFVALMVGLSSCSTPEVERNSTPRENFEFLWKTIDENYCYLDEKHINWDSIHDVYAPKVDTLQKCGYQFFDLMEEMLNNLQDGHVNVYSPFDKSVCRDWYKGYPTLYDAQTVSNLLGEDYRIAGSLQYKILSDSIGYIRYSSFEYAFSGLNLGYIFSYFQNCKGIILDVRHNTGGSLDYSYRLAAAFFKDQTTVGYRRHKTGTGHQDFSAMEAMDVKPSEISSHWLRPVIVLTDRYCYSATNHFVLCMQKAPNAITLGGRTGGGGGMPLSYELPNGWLIRFSAVAMYDTDQKSIEDGLNPAIAVDTADFSSGDPLVKRAIKELNSH